jgi:hypothetical protein
VTISWNATLRRQTVHAARRVACGEELTACFYGSDGLSGMLRFERQTYLLDKFHFVCACDLCGKSGEARAQSEARQRRLRAIGESMGTSPRPAYKRMRALVEEATGLLAAEQLPRSWAKLYMLRLISSSADTGDAKAAGEWARRAAACAREACGTDSAAYRAHLQ